MVANSVFIYREWNAIVGVNFSMMFNQVATRITSDIVYSSFIVTFTPFFVFVLIQRLINTNRVVSGTTICTKINNLCHILIN